ncbi:MAG: nitroreductase [Bacteroidia bacterium]
MNEVIKTIFERRAVRKYKEQGVSKDIIEQLLEAGRMAPSALGKQPWKFYIVTSKEDLELFSKEIIKVGMKSIPEMGIKKTVKAIVSEITHISTIVDFFKAKDPVFHGAPVAIFITALKDDEWAALDIGMCSQNIMLAAKSLGLETCPVGFATYIEKAEHYYKLGISSTEKVHLAIIVGYGDEKPALHKRNKENAFYK